MSLSEILPKDLWPRVLSFVSSSPRQLLQVSVICKEARCALQYVRLIHVDQAKELDVRVLKHFVGATTLSVSARRNVSRAEALAANHLPADFQFSYVGAVGAERFDWIYDEDIARRLPHALSALPLLEHLQFSDSWHFQEDPDQVCRAVLHALEGIADNRLAGGLAKLRIVNLGGYTCCMTTRVADAEEHDWVHYNHGLEESGSLAARCFCETMKRSWPVDSLLEFAWKDGGFCGTPLDFIDAAIRQGLDLNAPTRRWYLREGGMFPQRPTNFELLAATWIGKRQDGFYWRYDSIDLVEQLIQRGGRVGPVLRDAIASGRMRAFLEKDRWEYFNFEEEEVETMCRRLAALC